jgi:CRP-like cAMP-binding protein
LSEANQLLASLAQKTVKQRIAEVFLMLRTKFNEDAEGCIDIDLKRSEIADLVGTATESLIRLLSQFERDQLILRQGKRFRITQPRKLAQLAELAD